MIKITDYIHCYENLLDKDLCEAIIKNSKNLNFKPGSSTDTEFPPSIDNRDTTNIKNVMKKSSNYFS